MPELYGCADLMINVSTGEGFPLAVQEALACGLPVILLWDPGYGDSLERDVPLAIDRLDDLPTSLNSLVRDAHKRGVLSARGREWAVRRWHWANTAEGYERVYQRAIHDQSAGIHRSAEHARTTAS
jgi:glycosyltransferase involved in cell wall biosynthesis